LDTKSNTLCIFDIRYARCTILLTERVIAMATYELSLAEVGKVN